MIEFDTKVELDDVRDGFFGLTRRAETRKREFFRGIKTAAKKDLREHGRNREGPGGSWTPPAAATRAKLRRGRRRRRRDGNPLARGRNRRPGNLGAITRAWKSFQDPDALKLRNMVRFAAVHEEGGAAGRGASIPARPFAWWSRDFQQEAAEMWATWVLAGWKRGG